MTKVTVFEPLWAEGQMPVEPLFEPLRLPPEARPEWREFWIYVDIYRRGLHRNGGLTGLLSPKFTAKSGLSAEAMFAFVRAHAEADICLFSPMPQLPYIAYNVWQHGEDNHPGLIVATQTLLDAVGCGWPLRQEGRHSPAICCYANYWVASETFWDRYVGGLLVQIAEYLERNPSSEASHGILSATDYEVEAPFLPFAIERLLTTFLAHTPDLNVAAWHGDPLAAAYHDVQREIVRTMRDRIDAADREPSFPPDIAEILGLFSRLNIIYEASHFSVAPRPLSGEVVPLRRSQRTTTKGKGDDNRPTK